MTCDPIQIPRPVCILSVFPHHTCGFRRQNRGAACAWSPKSSVPRGFPRIVSKGLHQFRAGPCGRAALDWFKRR